MRVVCFVPLWFDPRVCDVMTLEYLHRFKNIYIARIYRKERSLMNLIGFEKQLKILIILRLF